MTVDHLGCPASPFHFKVFFFFQSHQLSKVTYSPIPGTRIEPEHLLVFISPASQPYLWLRNFIPEHIGSEELLSATTK